MFRTIGSRLNPVTHHPGGARLRTLFYTESQQRHGDFHAEDCRKPDSELLPSVYVLIAFVLLAFVLLALGALDGGFGLVGKRTCQQDILILSLCLCLRLRLSFSSLSL